MITVTKQENGVLFTFQDSDKYLYGSGTILVPFNSLSIVADESDMITLKKAASNDVFLSARYDTDFGYRSKDDAIDDLKDLLFAETGGGSESGITSGEVQTMIDNSLEDYYTDDEVDAALSGKASVSDVTALENEVATKADTSAVTAVASDVSTLSGQVATKVNTTDFSAYSAATDARLAEDEEVTAAALNDLQENKADTSAVTQEISAAISGKADTSAVTAVNDALTAHTSDTGIHVSAQEKNAWNAKAEPYSAGTGIEISGNVISATGGGGATYSAGTNISIDTANTINCTLPITANSATSSTFIAGNPSSVVNENILIGSTSLFRSNYKNNVVIGNLGTKASQDCVVIGRNATGGTNNNYDWNNIAIGSVANANGGNHVAIGFAVSATGTTKMNLNDQIKVDTNNQVYIKDKTNTTDVCIQDAIAALGGLKLVKLTQSEYDQLATKDPDTLYIITNVVS